MERKDLLLALLFGRGKTLRDNEKIPTETHLQKEMFLLMKETLFSRSMEYDFIAYYYGPFSPELRSDLNEYVFTGMIDEKTGISLTPEGFRNASTVWRNLKDNEKVAIIRVKKNYNFLSVDDLLDYVYNKFPKFTVKSALKPEVVYSYFEKFYDEHELTEEYIMDAYNRVRYPDQ